MAADEDQDEIVLLYPVKQFLERIEDVGPGSPFIGQQGHIRRIETAVFRIGEDGREIAGVFGGELQSGDFGITEVPNSHDERIFRVDGPWSADLLACYGLPSSVRGAGEVGHLIEQRPVTVDLGVSLPAQSESAAI